MNCKRLAPLLVLLPILLLSPAAAQNEPAATVPSDLRPLLTAPQSGMRIVAQRYRADRAQLDRFYRLPLSTAHLARLARFELAWSAALDELRGLDADAARELDELKATIRANRT